MTSFKLFNKTTGKTLARDYKKGQWYWTSKDHETHYFMTEKEAVSLASVLARKAEVVAV